MTYNIHWTCRAFLSAMPFSPFSTNQNKQCAICIFAFAWQWAPTVSSFQRAAELLPFPIPSWYAPLSLPFTIIIAIWPTNQCLVSSLEDAGACRQSYITISSSYHSLPPVTDTGRNWEEGKYRISSQSTCSQAKYITFLKMNKKNSSKNWQRENRKCFIFVCFSWRYTRHITQ